MEGFLGIDVSKGYADFALINSKGEKLVKAFQLDDTFKGHQKLRQWIDTLGKKSITVLYCGLESTGGFENNWLVTLKGLSSDIEVKSARINPSVIKNSSKAELTDNLTDAESAFNIANYLRRFNDKVDLLNKDNYFNGYRSLYNHILLQTKQKTQLINQLRSLMYSSFPEMQRYCKTGVPAWVLAILKKYPTASSLSKAKLETLCKFRNVTSKKAETMIEAARKSVGARQGDLEGFIIKNIANEISEKQTQIEALKKHLSTNCKSPETELLSTISGIGDYSAAALMVQIEDIKRFESTDKLVSYFGIHPVSRQSGDKQSKSRMSKQGRAAVRAILYMCAGSAVLHDQHLKSIYHRHRTNGMTHKQAIGVIMHKLLRMVWGVLNSGNPYNAETDKNNQAKGTQVLADQVANQTEKVRRMQEFDPEAPVSRKAFKKREAHAKSQSPDERDVRDQMQKPEDVNIKNVYI